MSKFTVGLAIGVVAGLLLAPDKGENTRKKLNDEADGLRDKFNRLVGRAGAELDDLRDYIGKDIAGLTDDVRHRILTIIDEAEEMSYSSGSTAANSFSNGVV